jgi:hypothetical protein
MLHLPHRLALEHIPREQRPAIHRRQRLAARRRILGQIGHLAGRRGRGVPAAGMLHEIGIVAIDDRHLHRRDIGDVGARIVRHRHPCMRADARRDHQERRLVEARAGHLDRPAGLHVVAGRPVHRHIGLGREQFAVGAIDHEEEAVLRRLDHHLARAVAQIERGQRHLLNRGEIPAFAGRLLIMPFICAGIGIDRDDRREEQIVALPVRADMVVPGGAVADADQKLVELGIVDDRIPDGAATAIFPPLAGPGGKRDLHRLVRRLMIGPVGGISGDGVEAPDLLAGRGIVGGDVAAHAKLGARIADDDLVPEYARCAGDRVRLGLIDRDDRPDRLAGGRIQRDQPAVDRADIHLALPHRDAAIDHVAAGMDRLAADHLRIIFPQHPPRSGIERHHLRPGGGGVHDPVDHERRRFLPAGRIEIDHPGGLQPRYRLFVDLVERAEARFGIAAAIGQPVTRGSCLVEPVRVDRAHARADRRHRRGPTEDEADREGRQRAQPPWTFNGPARTLRITQRHRTCSSPAACHPRRDVRRHACCSTNYVGLATFRCVRLGNG